MNEKKFFIFALNVLSWALTSIFSSTCQVRKEVPNLFSQRLKATENNRAAICAEICHRNICQTYQFIKEQPNSELPGFWRNSVTKMATVESCGDMAAAGVSSGEIGMVPVLAVLTLWVP